MSPFVQKLYAISVARYFDWLRLRHGKPLVLFFRDGGIGDILCTFPAAAALARRHERAVKVFCTNPGFVELPAMVGCFDRVLGIRCNDLVSSLVGRWHTVYRFRYPDESPPNASAAYLADEFSTGVGLDPGQPWPQLNAGKLTEKVAPLFERGDGRPIVCIHTGPTWAVREWPLERWDDLVAGLQARFSCRVLQVGASRHFREGARKERSVAGVEDCRDVFNLQETVQIISRSKLLVGIDSGMIHVAVGFGVPVVGLFGPTSAALRLPPGRAIGLSGDVPCLGCHHRHPRLHWQSGCAHEIQCMKNLSVQSVCESAAQFL